MLKSDDPHDRSVFRSNLVASIQRADAACALSASNQDRLIQELAELPSRGILRNPTSAPEAARLRALKKAASDARRLKQAIGRLDSLDAASLDQQLHPKAPLDAVIELLARVADSSERQAAAVAGAARAAKALAHGMVGFELLKVLEKFGLPCTVRNDFDSRPPSAADDRRILRGRARAYEFLPPLDSGASLGMRCALLVLFNEGVRELDWSQARTLISAGRKYGLAQQSLIDPSEGSNVSLLRLREVAPFLRFLEVLQPLLSQANRRHDGEEELPPPHLH